MNAWRRFRERRRIKSKYRHWEYERARLEFAASNGAHIPKSEREKYNLPDWTG